MKKILSMLLVVAMMLSLCGCSSSDYKKAVALFDEGDYAAAYEMFIALGDYEDSPEMATQCQYELATDLMEKGDYKSAATAFGALGSYADSEELAVQCRYKYAVDLIASGDYETAVAILEALGDYEDSEKLIAQCQCGLAINMVIKGEYEAALSAFEALEELDDDTVAKYVRPAKWGVLYNYIQQNGELDTDTGTHRLSSDLIQDYFDDMDELETISIYAESPEVFMLESYYCATNSAGVVNQTIAFSFIINMVDDTVAWDCRAEAIPQTIDELSLIIETGNGTVKLSEITENILLATDSCDYQMLDKNGKENSRYGIVGLNETISALSTDALVNILTTLPDILAETGLPITMADLGFTAVE